MNPIVRAVDLTRRFGPVTAVDGLNLEIERGEIFCLVGPDGAGKTTTLRLLCGLLDPSSGTAEVAGYDVRRHSAEVKDHIGYMAQRFGLYGDLTVEENMRFYADLFGMSGSERDALGARLLQMTRMDPFRSRPAAKLSGGMKQKLALMCTLLHKPEILFLDEPTNGVDPVSRRDFWAILYQLVKEGMTVFVTTAYLDEAERTNRVGLMSNGRLIRLDSPRALRTGLEETCYEVECRDPRAARQFLLALPGILSAEPSGGALHVFVAAGGPTRERLARSLETGGFVPVAIKEITPSLEDVFIVSIQKESARHAA